MDSFQNTGNIVAQNDQDSQYQNVNFSETPEQDMMGQNNLVNQNVNNQQNLNQQNLLNEVNQNINLNLSNNAVDVNDSINNNMNNTVSENDELSLPQNVQNVQNQHSNQNNNSSRNLVNDVLKALVFGCLFFILAHNDTRKMLVSSVLGKQLKLKAADDNSLLILMVVFVLMYILLSRYVL